MLQRFRVSLKYWWTRYCHWREIGVQQDIINRAERDMKFYRQMLDRRHCILTQYQLEHMRLEQIITEAQCRITQLQGKSQPAKQYA